MLARWVTGGHSGMDRHGGRRHDRGQIDGGPPDP
jgi:hypothetical protein